MQREPVREHLTPLYRHLIAGIRPVLMSLTRRDWLGGEHLPRTGGFVVACNHVSWVDPLVLAHFLIDHGRVPRFLAKSSLFETPVLRQICQGTGQIPVYRDTDRAVDAFSAAAAAVRAGACVVVMPEGTLTRDPGLWPMSGKSGAARIAMATGSPLVPVALWGPQQILWPYRISFPRVLPRKTMQVSAGAPVDFSDLPSTPDAATLRCATDRVMDNITHLLADLRGQDAPAQRLTYRGQSGLTPPERR